MLCEYFLQLYPLMGLPEECRHNVHKFHYLTFCAWKSSSGGEGAALSQAQLKLNLRAVQIAQHTSVPTDAPSDEGALCVCVGKDRNHSSQIQRKAAMSDFKILVRVQL